VHCGDKLLSLYILVNREMALVKSGICLHPISSVSAISSVVCLHPIDCIKNVFHVRQSFSVMQWKHTLFTLYKPSSHITNWRYIYVQHIFPSYFWPSALATMTPYTCSLAAHIANIFSCLLRQVEIENFRVSKRPFPWSREVVFVIHIFFRFTSSLHVTLALYKLF